MKKQTIEQKAFISYCKKWLLLDEFSTATLNSCEGEFKAICRLDENMTPVVAFSLNGEYFGVYLFNNDLNKWVRLE